jgi:hypothetical protein
LAQKNSSWLMSALGRRRARNDHRDASRARLAAPPGPNLAAADAVEGRAPYRITADEILENTKIFEGIVCSAAAKGAPVLFTPR